MTIAVVRFNAITDIRWSTGCIGSSVTCTALRTSIVPHVYETISAEPKNNRATISCYIMPTTMCTYLQVSRVMCGTTARLMFYSLSGSPCNQFDADSFTMERTGLYPRIPSLILSCVFYVIKHYSRFH